MKENVNKYFTGKNIIFVLMLILFLIFLVRVMDIALMFFASFIVSATLVPFVDKLSLKMPRALATSIVLLLTLGVILGILIPLIIFSVKQGAVFILDLPDILDEFRAKFLNVDVFGYNLSSFITGDNILNFTNEVAGDIIVKSVDITKVILNIVTTILAVSIMVFYICYDKDGLKNGFVKLFPEKFKNKATTILNSITERVGGYVFAQLLAMVFTGFVTMIGLLILQNEKALLLGFITCIFDIVPAIGPTVAVLIGLLVVSSKGIWYIIATFAVYIIAQILENQVLRPVIFGKFMNMHPLTIILSLLIGAKFIGFWGVVLGPAIASVVCVLIDELYIKPINKIETDSEKS